MDIEIALRVFVILMLIIGIFTVPGGIVRLFMSIYKSKEKK